MFINLAKTKNHPLIYYRFCILESSIRTSIIVISLYISNLIMIAGIIQFILPLPNTELARMNPGAPPTPRPP